MTAEIPSNLLALWRSTLEIRVETKGREMHTSLSRVSILAGKFITDTPDGLRVEIGEFLSNAPYFIYS